MEKFRVTILFVLLSLASVQSNFLEFEFRSADIPPPPPPPPQQSTNFDYHPKIRFVDVMVDITNDLSYRILQQHSIANRNNFAFSPTSLASVMIALFEGSQGGGATEIYNVLKLPWNRDLLRIGYRDIHRRLRKYFFNEENPLTGLTLSRENVTITSQYEDILQFYGYDLRTDMHPFNDLSPTQSTTTATSTVSESTTSTTQSTTTIMESSTTSTSESTTTKAEESTTASSSSTTTTMSTTTESSTTPSSTTVEQTTTTVLIDAASDAETTTLNSEPHSSSAAAETTSEPAANSDTETTTVTATSTTTIDEETTTAAAEDLSTTTLNEETTTMPEDTTEAVETTTLTSAKLVNTIAPDSMLFPLSRSRRPVRNRETMLYRVKRQYPLYYGNQPAPPFTITVTPIRMPLPQPPVSDFHFVSVDHNVDSNLNDLYEPKRDPNVEKKEIYHVFYLNAHESIQTRYKVFNTILRFTYIQNIRSSALALDLDSPDYELVIMIPDYNFGLDFLLQGLKLAPTLRAIRQEMRPRWVQAIVPDFKLKGNIFLTNDLQNMGILEVFEPARADFSPMTNESDIYVKHIEQKINVHLRTRPIDQLKRYVGPYNRPIEVSVNHPFLFFIVDKELDVAIMAGRVLNPLNVRIH